MGGWEDTDPWPLARTGRVVKDGRQYSEGSRKG